MMRLRIDFAKTEAMRFTSHLDLHRTWERTLRRAGLPLAYSQGFKPHPRIVLASALPLGFTSQAEVVDIWLEDQIPLEQVKSALQRAIPPGLQIESLSEAEPGEPALPAQVVAQEYRITFPAPIPDLDQRVQGILQAGSLVRSWRDKSYDLRPLILNIERLSDDAEACPQLLVTLAAREGATGRPEELVRALEESPEQAHFHRTRLIFGSN